jgi:uroporphyrinogen decarboxylase
VTRRERIRRALAHAEADQVPVDFGSRSSAIEEQAYAGLLSYLGLSRPVTTFIRGHADMDEDILDFLGVDTAWVRSIPPDSWRTSGPDRVFVDRWGVPWRRAAGSPYYEIDHSPLEGLDPAEVLATRWELITDDMVKDMQRQVPDLRRRGDRALFSDVVGAGIFERAWYLRGFQNLLTEMMTEKAFVHQLFENILEAQLQAYAKLLDGVGDDLEGVLITDDLATQDGLLMSRDLYREMIKPYHGRLIESIQRRGVSVIFHCCGAIRSLLPDLIDAGVRIIHPVQVSAHDMDALELKRQFGADLTFWGGGCDTKTLQLGSEKDVREEVRRRVGDLAPGGGFVFTTTHCIQPGTPPRSIVAMISALSECGRYGRR